MADVTSIAGAANAASRVDTGRTRLADSYETFMALLTTQLRNQDPTSPLDTNQFTQQLVQMTGVEQQLLTNDLLKEMAAAASGGVTSAVGYIGKTVTASGDTAALSGSPVTWGYQLPRDAASATVEVLDSAGQVIRRETAEIKAGSHTFTWDGKNASGGKAADGLYTLRVKAADASGATINAALNTTGVIRAIEQAENGTVLVLNGVRIPLSAVTAVRETETAQATTNSGKTQQS